MNVKSSVFRRPKWSLRWPAQGADPHFEKAYADSVRAYRYANKWPSAAQPFASSMSLTLRFSWKWKME